MNSKIKSTIEKAMKSIINQILINRITNFDSKNICKCDSFSDEKDSNLTVSPNTSLCFSLDDSILDDMSFISTDSNLTYALEIYYKSKDFQILTERWFFSFPLSTCPDISDIVNAYGLGGLSKSVKFLSKFLPMYSVYKNSNVSFDISFILRNSKKNISHFNEKIITKTIKIGNFFNVKYIEKKDYIFEEQEKFNKKKKENFFRKKTDISEISDNNDDNIKYNNDNTILEENIEDCDYEMIGI